jgi:hypothetical protein
LTNRANVNANDDTRDNIEREHKKMELEANMVRELLSTLDEARECIASGDYDIADNLIAYVFDTLAAESGDDITID